MNEIFEQFAFLDTLLNNWDGIRIRMGVLSHSLEQEFTRIANKLNSIESTDDIPILIDKLLDLTEETPAYDYVRDLIVRSRIPTPEKTRGPIGETATLALPPTVLAESTMDLSRCFAQTVETVVAYRLVPVFFATNRKVQPAKLIEDCYTGEDSEELKYGYVEVTIPVQRHKMGNTELPRPIIEKEDKERHIVLNNLDGLEMTEFATKLAQKLEEKQRKELLIFLHGYNVTFEEAARCAAQVAWDINFPGAVILFSWPSQGSLLGYLADEGRAMNAASPFRTFFSALENGPWSKVHVIAHSMGNRVMVAALAQSTGFALPLKNIVLASADVYVDNFKLSYSPLSRPKSHGIKMEAG